jgi:hypothetical protein
MWALLSGIVRLLPRTCTLHARVWGGPFLRGLASTFGASARASGCAMPEVCFEPTTSFNGMTGLQTVEKKLRMGYHCFRLAPIGKLVDQAGLKNKKCPPCLFRPIWSLILG